MFREKFAALLFDLAIFAPKVLACTLVAGANPNTLAERQNEVYKLLGISLFFALAASFLYFKKGKKGILLVIASFLTIGFAFLTGNVYGGDCGESALSIARTSILLTVACFTFQFFTWLIRKRAAGAELP